ncbi:hypothetical protein ABTX62_37000 [Streptomyces sp. NPDC096046]|uniref:hypothetical protein n=1 Tax=Streptomyces sp. NPDC096046 TaxID=3155542 RepID=UPI00331A6D30
MHASRLAPALPPADAVNGMESVLELLKRFEKLAKKGGTFSMNPEAKPYVFYDTQHLSMAQIIGGQPLEARPQHRLRNVLDHLKTHHDDQALVEMPRSGLTTKWVFKVERCGGGPGLVGW